QQERIFVAFSYQRLATLGISPVEIFSALSRQNSVTPAGSVDTDGSQVFVRLDGAYTDVIKSATPRSSSDRKASNCPISRMSREATKIRQLLSFGTMESPPCC